MKIIRIYNNNALLSLSKDNEEVVIIGRGIAFQKKAGEEIDESKIEKIFTLENKDIQTKLGKLLDSLSPIYLQICEEIVSIFKKQIEAEISDNIYITLTDHLSVSLEREKNNIIINNPLLPEIKQFYKKEYELAKKSAIIVKQHLGIDISDEEIGFITLHLINAIMHNENSDMIKVTTLINEIVSIIEDFFKRKLDDTSLHYTRFIRHLQFFIHRILSNNLQADTDILILLTKQDFPEATACVDEIVNFIKRKYHIQVSEAESSYLVYHIANITKTNKKG